MATGFLAETGIKDFQRSSWEICDRIPRHHLVKVEAGIPWCREAIYQATGRDIAQTKVYSRHKNLGNLGYYIGTTDDTSLILDLK